MKRITLPRWIRALIAIGTILLFIGVAIGSLFIQVAVFRNNYFAEIPDHVTIENVSDLQPLTAVGRGI